MKRYILKRNIVQIFQSLKLKFKIDRKSFIISHIKKNNIVSILEIGVFNGNFGMRMIDAIKKRDPSASVNYVGVDLFEDKLTDDLYISEISLRPLSIEDVLKKLSKFKNTKINLIGGNSKDILPTLIGKMNFDLIVIDGGHSHETVLSDWNNSIKLLKTDGVIFFDDYTNLRGQERGGFGINSVVDNIDKRKFKVVISVNRDFFWKQYGLLVLYMVKVTRIK